MLDFTSALYLGLAHPSRVLGPWESLTTGRPAALEALPDEGRVAAALATLVGCETAVLGPSTLHLFWDLFGWVARFGFAVFVDAGVYPIARWGTERAAGLGAPVRPFSHHDPEALRRLLRRSGPRPVVVTDGLDPGRDEPAPLSAYLECVRPRGGLLVVDDTQALGILGEAPGPGAPYGRGGGGSLRWHGIAGPEVLLVSSLAKGFGAPLGMLAGSRPLVEAFREVSETRVHCSPPSAVVIRAAEHALAVNARWGEPLREGLAENVASFRRVLWAAGIRPAGGGFPVQTLGVGLDAAALHAVLGRNGIRAVLHRDRQGAGPLVSFLLTARHRTREVEHAAHVLARAVREHSIRPRRSGGHHEKRASF